MIDLVNKLAEQEVILHFYNMRDGSAETVDGSPFLAYRAVQCHFGEILKADFNGRVKFMSPKFASKFRYQVLVYLKSGPGDSYQSRLDQLTSKEKWIQINKPSEIQFGETMTPSEKMDWRLSGQLGIDPSDIDWQKVDSAKQLLNQFRPQIASYIEDSISRFFKREIEVILASDAVKEVEALSLKSDYQIPIAIDKTDEKLDLPAFDLKIVGKEAKDTYTENIYILLTTDYEYIDRTQCNLTQFRSLFNSDSKKPHIVNWLGKIPQLALFVQQLPLRTKRGKFLIARQRFLIAGKPIPSMDTNNARISRKGELFLEKLKAFKP